MDKEKLNLLVLAGLLHDIGKLFERADSFPEIKNDPFYLAVCPPRNGYYSHLHCAYTKKFCELLHNSFSCLKNKVSKPDWLDWASCHHLNNQDFETTIISRADRLSAEEREEGSFYTQKIHLRTLLEPVLERVYLSSNQKLYTSYRYPLTKLDLKNIFPLQAQEFSQKGIVLDDWQEEAGNEVKDPASWSHLLAKDPLTANYEKIANGLLEDVKHLAKTQPDLPLEDLIVSLLTLLEIYTVNIPSATNLRHPDISLFDHLRTTAAIAQALYFYNDTQDADVEENKNYWLLVCGDFSGIQKFIYNLTNKGAAKHLRARSFYVQYFCQLCAEFLLRELGLNKVALLYSSGGKFYLLIPAILKEKLISARRSINDWLIKKFAGQVFLGIGLCEVNDEMFELGKMDTAWSQCAKDLEKDRKIKFKEQLTPEFFQPRTEFNPTQSCSVCGAREEVKNNKCHTCNQLENLGKKLSKASVVLTVWDKTNFNTKLKPVLDFNFGPNPSLYLLEQSEADKLAQNMGSLDANWVFLTQDVFTNFRQLSLPRCGFSFMYLGRWKSKHYLKNAWEEWTFDDYARNSEGIKRLGILRMDVDNLGLVFISGLKFAKRQAKGWGKVEGQNKQVERRSMASISRMATLSRQLNCFFSGYLNIILEDKQFDRSQIMYAGGDDLFIIGSWDQLIRLAKRIKDEFARFCCFNPDMSISGGVTLIPGKYPIYKGAILAGEAEERAKTCRKNWEKYLQKKQSSPLEDIKKSGFCFVDTAIVWEDFELVEEIRELLIEEIEEEKNKGLISYLLKMQAQNCLHAQNAPSLSEGWLNIEYAPWRWRFAYQLRRRYKNKEDKIKKWSELVLGNGQDRAVLPVFSWLALPLNWVKLLYRKEEG